MQHKQIKVYCTNIINSLVTYHRDPKSTKFWVVTGHRGLWWNFQVSLKKCKIWSSFPKRGTSVGFRTGSLSEQVVRHMPSLLCTTTSFNIRKEPTSSLSLFHPPTAPNNLIYISPVIDRIVFLGMRSLTALGPPARAACLEHPPRKAPFGRKALRAFARLLASFKP